MVIFTSDPWLQTPEPEQNGKETIELESPGHEHIGMFGAQDLASDYFQVMWQKSRPKNCKMIWGILITGLAILTGFMVYNLLSEYFQYNSFSSSSTVFVGNLTLPAITICSTNVLNYTKVCYNFKCLLLRKVITYK